MWGGASSGIQSEGAAQEDGRGESVWDAWYKQQPNRFFEGVGPEPASDFYHNYKELVARMRQAGIRSFRTTPQWCRVEKPDGSINDEGAAFYHRLLDELEKNEIEPIFCLHHFDLPLWHVKNGGFENRAVALAFGEYAKTMFGLYGGRVKRWATFNEPFVIVEQAYGYHGHYPDVCDNRRAVQAGHNIQLAHALAVRAFRETGQTGKIGTILNLTPTYCENKDDPQDARAGKIAELLLNRSFLEPAVFGEYPPELVELLKSENLLPHVHAQDKEIIRQGRVDFLGVNYYHPRRVRPPKDGWNQSKPLYEKFFEEYLPENAKINPYRGWEIYERAVYDIAIDIKERYGNIPWYLSENGMGVQDEERFLKNGRIEDSYRITFMQEHLKWLHRAVLEGCSCFGYHIWSPFDCWSWLNAYKNRYGLIRVDIKNGCALSLKKSADWFFAVSKNNEFSADEE